LLLTIIPLLNCGKKSDFKKLNPSFLWEKDQTVIEPSSGTKHMWSGFSIKNDFFVPNKTIAKFIIWKEKEQEVEMTINYLLKGMSVDVFINSIKRFKLKPRYQLKPFKATAALSKGFNFIEFKQKGKTQLKIKSIKIGQGTTDEINRHHLPKGEKLTLFHSAGSGEISLKGKGKLHIKKVQFIKGKKNVSETEIEAGALSGSKTYTFDFQTMGFLQLSTTEGTFDIAGYTFKKRVEKKEPLNIKTKTLLKEKPHIFIFLIDGCHTFHLGVYGYHRDTSPNIDRFAKDGVIFDNAYANATFTRSSVATLFTGFYPHRHKLRILTNRLPKGLFLLPEFLKKTGYKTALLTEAGNISKFFGFSQGVDHYRKVFRRWDDPRYLENNTFKSFNEWLKTEGALFTYVHYRAPHFPIVPPPPFLDMYKEKKYGVKHDRLIFHLKELGEKGYAFTPEEVRDIIADYDSSIRYVDAEVGKLIDTLKTKGLYDSSFIIFTSDHGEALYEHGYWGHGTTVYDEASRVPLIVKFPAEMKLNGRIETIVQLADIFPTIAALFGENRYFDGRNLLEAIRAQKIDDSFAFSTSFGTPPTIGIRWRYWHYIIYLHNNREELFNLKINPLKNVAGLKENEDLIIFFRAKFLHWLYPFDNLERTSQSVDLKKLPKEEYENLKSLGYIN
jgi:arylsulfatase A-like enzyme